MTRFKIHNGTVPGSINLCESCSNHTVVAFRSGRSRHQCRCLGILQEPAVFCPYFQDIALKPINDEQAWRIVGAGTEKAKILPSYEELCRRKALEQAENEPDDDTCSPLEAIAVN